MSRDVRYVKSPDAMDKIPWPPISTWQGPITMISGKQGLVEFRNPFDKPTDFSLQALGGGGWWWISLVCFETKLISVVMNLLVVWNMFYFS